jgi:hypothetical protein
MSELKEYQSSFDRALNHRSAMHFLAGYATAGLKAAG